MSATSHRRIIHLTSTMIYRVQFHRLASPGRPLTHRAFASAAFLACGVAFAHGHGLRGDQLIVNKPCTATFTVTEHSLRSDSTNARTQERLDGGRHDIHVDITISTNGKLLLYREKWPDHTQTALWDGKAFTTVSPESRTIDVKPGPASRFLLFFPAAAVGWGDIPLIRDCTPSATRSSPNLSTGDARILALRAAGYGRAGQFLYEPGEYAEETVDGVTRLKSALVGQAGLASQVWSFDKYRRFGPWWISTEFSWTQNVAKAGSGGRKLEPAARDTYRLMSISDKPLPESEFDTDNYLKQNMSAKVDDGQTVTTFTYYAGRGSLEEQRSNQAAWDRINAAKAARGQVSAKSYSGIAILIGAVAVTIGFVAWQRKR